MYLIEPIRNGEYITDGAVSTAMQVYVSQNIFLDDDILLPYYCDPKVEIGRFQNTAVEINQDYVDAHDIQVMRRETGGGAVYVDRGAVNMCCLLQNDNSIYGDCKKFYEPAINELHHLGANEVVQSGRNDLEINGKKVSGAAMTLIQGRIYGGYSLLLDVDYEPMVKVLKPNRKKIESKGIKSVRSRVGNIRDYLAAAYQDVTIHEFKDLMVEQLLELDDINNAKRYELNRDAKLAAGTVDITLSVEKGRIAACRIYGDFFGQGNIKEVEQQLIGVRVIKADLLEALSAIDVAYYFGKASAEELVDLI